MGHWQKLTHSKRFFAFEWESPKSGHKTQLTWMVLPQGLEHEKDLESWKAPSEGKLLQYVDDLLIATRTEEGYLDSKPLKLSGTSGAQGVEEQGPGGAAEGDLPGI